MHTMTQVVWVNRYAVSTNPRSWVESLEAERLRCRHINHVPEINVKLMTEFGHFVDEGDIHVSVCIFKQFCRLGLTSSLRHHHSVNELAIQRRGPIGTSGRHAANYFRRIRHVEFWVTWVNSFRRKRQV